MTPKAVSCEPGWQPPGFAPKPGRRFESVIEIRQKEKVILVSALLAAVTVLHYATGIQSHHLHIIYQGLYYIPLILAAFWFGLRGALAGSVGITLLYTPFILIYWEGFSQSDFSRVMEIVHYFMVALIVGWLSDRQRLQQKRLSQSERLAAVGQAMAGVAHDMKTPLIAIGGFTNLVKTKIRKVRLDEESFEVFAKDAEDKLLIVLKESRRLENMVKDMLDFSRPLELQKSKENVDELVSECVALVSGQAEEKRVRVVAVQGNGFAPVSLDATRIKQALINLLMNAIQASPEGETVTVRSYRNGRSLTIDVTDCGCGIPMNKREEIFSPFFTTKKEGTGLGLPLVIKIIEAHEGRLQIVDNPEKGITFRVLVPIS